MEPLQSSLLARFELGELHRWIQQEKVPKVPSAES